MKSVIFFLLLSFTALNAASTYQKLWHHDAPLDLNKIRYSKNYDYAVLSNSNNISVIYKIENSAFITLDTFKTNYSTYFDNEDYLISIDTTQKQIYTYNPEDRQKDTINLDFVDFTYGKPLFFNRYYIAINNNQTASTILYSINNKSVEYSFLTENGESNDKMVISKNNDYVIGLSSYNICKYNLINHKMEFKKQVPVIGSGIFSLHTPIDTAIIITNSNYMLTISTNSGDTILTKDTYTSNYCIFSEANQQIYFNNYLSKIVLINYLTGEESILPKTTYNLTNYVKVDKDTSFYSGIQSSDEYDYISIYYYNKSIIDTIYKNILNDTLSGQLTFGLSLGYEIFGNTFLCMNYFYNILNKERLNLQFIPDIYYQKYDNNSIYSPTDDGKAYIIYDIYSQEPIDTIRQCYDEYSSSFKFTFDKKYYIPNGRYFIRALKDTTKIIDFTPPSYKQDTVPYLFKNNSDYFYTYKKKMANINNVWKYLSEISVWDFNTLKPIFTFTDTTSFEFNFSGSVMPSTGEEFLYYSISDSTLRFRNIISGNEEKLSYSPKIEKLILSKDNNYVAIINQSNGYSIDIFNFKTHQKEFSIDYNGEIINDYLFADNLEYLVLMDGNYNIDVFKLDLEFADVKEDNTPSHSILSLYPNPAANMLNISSQENIENISIYDINGECVYKSDEVNANTFTQNIQFLSSGNYYLKADIGKMKVSKRFVVSR